MRFDESTGKGTSGMNKFVSVIDRMNMKLGSNFHSTLRIKAQLLKKAPACGAEALVLFLCGAQLILWSSVLTVLDEVNVTLENAETFGSVLSGEGGSIGGGWRCC